MSTSLPIPKNFLFRFRVPCHYTKTIWESSITKLDESFLLQSFEELESGDLQSCGNVELRAGWNEKGLVFHLEVTGKKQTSWCRSQYPDDSDGLQLCIDTRDVHDLHRATRFCHRLICLPFGNDGLQKIPQIFWLPIHRAKNHPNPIDVTKIRAKSETIPGGYRLELMIPGEVLTGYDPQEYTSLGFHYVVTDREIGNHHFLVSSPFPHDQDPSIWCSLALVQ
ncbi:MAG: hypothetical protein ACRCUY_11325 [Thermoguttaceae bacterium]